jgi:glycosyltransferase involved in cell wall biosynthesis
MQSASRWKRVVQRGLLRRADAVSFTNPFHQNLWPVRPQRLAHLPYPVDVAFWSQEVDRDPAFWAAFDREPPTGPVITYASHIMSRKAQAELVDALAPVLLRRPEVLLVLSGWIFEQDELDRVFAAIERHGLADQVLFTGFLEHKDVRQLLQWATMAVFNTRAETQCMAVFEVLAAGVPTLISSIPVLTEAFPMLPAHSNQRELAVNVERALDDPAWAQSLVDGTAELVRWADIGAHDEAFRSRVAALGLRPPR